MKRGVDASVLVYAHLPVFREHNAVRQFLLEQLRHTDTTLVLTTGVLHAWIDAVTDARRFTPPVPMAEAQSVARSYLGRSNIELAPMDAPVMERALDLVEGHGLAPERLAAALFAATLTHHGVNTLITCAPEHFEGWSDLRLIDPRT